MSARQSAAGSPHYNEWRRVYKQHPLGRLHGKALNSYTLEVPMGVKNRFGASYFRGFLRSTSGDLSLKLVVLSLFNQGKCPGYNWIEVITFRARISFYAEGK